MVVLRNCGESESDKVIEYSEELDCLNFPRSPIYFPPSPTTFPPSPSYSPLYSPPSPPRLSSSNSSVAYVWTGVATFVPQNELGEDIVDLPDFCLAELVEHKIQDRGGALDVIPSGRLVKINELVQGLDDIVDSKAKKKALEYVDENYSLTTGLHLDCKPLEKQNEDIVDQLVVDSVLVKQYLIQYRDGALDTNLLGVFMRTNGSEISEGQLLTSTPEPALIFQAKLSRRLWLGHRGQWVADTCYEWNWLNIGTLKTAEGAPLSSESVLRFRGGKDLFDYPFSELFVNENRAEPTTKPRTEIQMLELSPTEEQENPYEDFELGCSEATGNDGVQAEATRNDGFEAVGIRSCNGCDNTPIQEVIQSTLKYACREYGIHIWPPHTNTTPMLVDQEEFPPLNSDTLPSNQALAATVDTNSVLVKEIPPPLILPTTRQENQDKDLGSDEVEVAGIMGEGTKEGEIAEVQLNSGPFGKRKRKEKTLGGENGNKKTTGVRNVIPLEEILQIKEMLRKDAAKHLKVSQSKLKSSCREYGIHRWPPRDEHKLVRQSLPDEIPPIVDQDGIPQLISNCVPSNQPLVATDDANTVVKEIPPPWISPTPRQENRYENFANDEIDVIGMGGVGTGEGEMEEGQLNSGCSGKGKRIEQTSREERGNNKTTGVRIAISLEDILQTKEMRLKDAAKHLNVSRSTLKRACREYNIYRWPPREELKLSSQYSPPNKSPTVVGQGQIPQLNYDTLLPSNQVPTTMNTNSTVTVKARCGKETIKFCLSWPWGTAELKQQVKKRLELEDGTYYIRYKDEDDELILIACDDDLQDCVSSSSPLGSKSIEILLEPK